MLSRIFEKDLQAKAFGEASELSYLRSADRLRLRPPGEVRDILRRCHASLIVMKPLVESQNTAALLTQFENSKALWIYRHFKDVALSNVSRFGETNGINDLLPIVNGSANNWRAEGITGESRDLVRRCFSPDMNPCDAAVLFWIVRNSLFFDKGLDANPNVVLCKYEVLTKNPSVEMKRIYDFAGQAYPGDRIVSGIHTESVRKGAEIELDSEVEAIAVALLKRMDQWLSRK